MHIRVPMRIAGSVVAVAAATLLVWALKPVVPTLSLGVVYLLAVLPVAIAWGLVFALPVAVASMLAFNWFFLPPVHTFSLADSANWAALGVFCATAIVVSELAARARRQAAAAVEAEALRRSDLTKTALLRAVSHDFRSPITGIATAAGALLSANLALSDDDRRNLLETIAVDAARLERLVSDLLDLSRLEAGGVNVVREVWAVDDLVRQVVGDLDARERVQVLGVPAIVDVDAVQVERVLANLIENALKFSPPTSPVKVEVGATFREAIVRVADVGPGLPAGELERVFEPFHRLPGGVVPGAGLGLAIARGFAEANGGRVWAESRPGPGATFALSLPLVTVPPELAG